MENETPIDLTRESYFLYLDSVVRKYGKANLVYHTPGTDSAIKLKIKKRSGLKLEFEDTNKKRVLLSIDDFLEHAEVIETPEEEARSRRRNAMLYSGENGLAEEVRLGRQ